MFAFWKHPSNKKTNWKVQATWTKKYENSILSRWSFSMLIKCMKKGTFFLLLLPSRSRHIWCINSTSHDLIYVEFRRRKNFHPWNKNMKFMNEKWKHFTKKKRERRILKKEGIGLYPLNIYVLTHKNDMLISVVSNIYETISYWI